MFFIVVIIIVIYLCYSSGGFKKECSDTRCYKVLNDQYSQESAKLLSRLNQFNIALCRYMRTRSRSGAYANSPVLESIVQLLLSRYDPDSLSEYQANPNDTAVTINKGEFMKFCLKGSNGTGIVDWDTLIFVNLHEITHVATLDMDAGHSHHFWSSFKSLLVEAKEAGLYKPVDYSKSAIQYCGMKISYNPYYNYPS